MRTMLLLGLALVVSCGGKKPTEAAGPKVGWHGGTFDDDTEWPGQCYYPPDWDSMGVGDKRIARQEVLESMMSQWKGEREDGMTIDEDRLYEIETVLLGRPEAIDQVSVGNVQRCEDFMKGKGRDAGPWRSFVKSLPAKLTEGECPWPPLDYQLYDYLEIDTEWQIKVKVCQGDKIVIKGTEMDYYKWHPKSAWVNSVGGDESTMNNSDFPCQAEGCMAGQLIFRFTAKGGGYTDVRPVGIQTVFNVPEHGHVQVMINDPDLTDNRYKVESGLQHKMAVTFQPAEKGI